MADGSKIEWTDATWNPITGCQVVSPGCTNCYAMQLAGTRMKHHPSRRGLTRDTKAGPVWTGETRLNEEWLDQPLRWKKPRRIFVCAHGDLFAESVPDEWIDRVFAVMALTPQHTFQVLSKRAKRMRDYIGTRTGDWMLKLPEAVSTPSNLYKTTKDRADAILGGNEDRRRLHRGHVVAWPLPNVWLGVSIEDQARADERIPDLLATPAAKRFLSCEPLLGPVDLQFLAPPDGDKPRLLRVARLNALTGARGEHGTYYKPVGATHIDWVIVGGESGANARPMNISWASSLVAQCRAAGVACFVKQLGANPFWQEDARAPLPIKDKKGGDWSEWPAELRVREFPA